MWVGCDEQVTRREFEVGDRCQVVIGRVFFILDGRIGVEEG